MLVLQGYMKKQITRMQEEKWVVGQQRRKGIQGDYHERCIRNRELRNSKVHSYFTGNEDCVDFKLREA